MAGGGKALGIFSLEVVDGEIQRWASRGRASCAIDLESIFDFLWLVLTSKLRAKIVKPAVADQILKILDQLLWRL